MYAFDDYTGENINSEEPSGFIEASLNFAGMIFNVSYDIEEPNWPFQVSIAGYYPDLDLKDGRGVSILEAVQQAQKQLWFKLYEQCKENA